MLAETGPEPLRRPTLELWPPVRQRATLPIVVSDIVRVVATLILESFSCSSSNHLEECPPFWIQPHGDVGWPGNQQCE